VEWDEKMKHSVGIYNIEHQFVHIKWNELRKLFGNLIFQFVFCSCKKLW
jgi:hypothetical protein